MNQAILITAYKNFHHLEEIVDFFNKQFRFYIHIDKKSKITEKQILKLGSNSLVNLVSQEYNVNWGGLNHLNAILYLSKKALANKENSYFHLISGHDFPIKSPTHFAEFFQTHKDNEFINFFNVPKPGWADNDGMDRLEFYNLYDILNAKNPQQNNWIRKFINFQKRLNIKRSFPQKFPTIYGGSTWWSLSRQALEYVSKYTHDNPAFLNRFKYTLCSEEFYFQTVILNNSDLRKRVINNNLRHIDWVARNGNNPAVLDKSDLATLLHSEAFFARKFDYPISKDLLISIKKEILHLKFGNKNNQM